MKRIHSSIPTNVYNCVPVYKCLMNIFTKCYLPSVFQTPTYGLLAPYIKKCNYRSQNHLSMTVFINRV